MRLVFVVCYSPRPWFAERLVVGAQVLEGERMFVVDAVPEYLTGMDRRMAESTMRAARDGRPGYLANYAGPHASIDGPRMVPEDAGDAVEWTRRLLLVPNPLAAGPAPKEKP